MIQMEFAKFKKLSFVITILYFTLGYLSINWLMSFRATTYDIMLPFEQKIPFIPVFILGYLLVYFTVLGLYFLIKDEKLFKKSIYAFLLMTTLHYAFFLLLPVRMVLRPALIPTDGAMNELVRLYYIMDAPQNCFPSLHVAYTFLGVLLFWNYKRAWAYIYVLCTIVVALSVIFVKQHYIMDVVGGLITPVIVYKIAGLGPRLRGDDIQPND